MVHTPDLFDGVIFQGMTEATAYRDAIGIPELMRRAGEAVTELRSQLVYAGYSMGAAAAEVQAATRPGARAAILLHGALPLAAIGGRWPSSVPAALRYGEADPLLDATVVERLVADLQGRSVHVERFTYPGAAHPFADPELAEYDSRSADLMWNRVTSFLQGLASD